MTTSPPDALDLADTVADEARTLDTAPPLAGIADAVPDDLHITQEHPGRYSGPRRKGLPPAPAPIELGRGGIGRVCIAHDAHIGREVAVKELLPRGDALGTPTSPTRPQTNPRHSLAAARFLREARLTGQLEHPNIVPVYELGRRPDGTLYYTMKVVRGRTMADAVGEAKSLGDRLKLLKHYADLCDAIAYAHSRGVIHRDIKPDNVMVGEFGETVVLDWGLAKSKDGKDIHGTDMAVALESLHSGDDLAQTSDGTLLGTPLFMSPEQAQGLLDEVDERSDVWALGVVLYELLTGTTPFTGRSAVELLVAICKQPLPPVREREPSAPPELAAIAERALRKDKTQRYPDARALAEEVRAYLTGGRVRAYEYGIWQLVKRWAARHKGVLAVSLAAAAALVTLGVWSYVSIGAERDQAMASKQAAEVARVKAETAERGATDARDNAEVLVRFMLDDLKTKLEPLGQTGLLDDVAHAVQGYYQRDAAAGATDPKRTRNRAAVVALLGDIARVRGDLLAAGKAYDEAQVLRETLSSARPSDSDVQADLAESWRQRGLVLRMQGELPGAAAAFDKALALRRQVLAGDPASNEHARAAVESELDRGDIASLMGERERAVASFEKAVEEASTIAEREDDALARFDLTLALDALGTARLDGGDIDRAAESFQKALEIRKALLVDNPANAAWQHRLSVSYSRLAEVARKKGDTAKAREDWDQARLIMEGLAKQDPANTRWLRDLSVYWNQLADLDLVSGKVDAAVAGYRHALDYVQSLSLRDPSNAELDRDVEVGKNRIGDALMAAGKPADASVEFEAGLAIAERLAGQDATNAQWRHDFALSLSRVALARWRLGDSEGAVPLQERALKVFESLVAADPSNPSWVKDRDGAQASLGDHAARPGDTPLDAGAEERRRARGARPGAAPGQCQGDATAAAAAAAPVAGLEPGARAAARSARARPRRSRPIKMSGRYGGRFAEVSGARGRRPPRGFTAAFDAVFVRWTKKNRSEVAPNLSKPAFFLFLCAPRVGQQEAKSRDESGVQGICGYVRDGAHRSRGLR
ncbi:MAG: protein kinase [Myxococcota bacterium]